MVIEERNGPRHLVSGGVPGTVIILLVLPLEALVMAALRASSRQQYYETVSCLSVCLICLICPTGVLYPLNARRLMLLGGFIQDNGPF